MAMKYTSAKKWLGVLAAFLCTASTAPVFAVDEKQPEPVDAHATAETEALFVNLRALAQKKILFGHHHTTAIGIGWRWEPERSDVRTLVGDYPAVHSWDFRFIEEDAGGHRAVVVRQIIEAFERGAVITLSWHMSNPVSGGNYAERTPAVGACLPGGEKHEAFLRRLDTLVQFLSELRDAQGRPVPVIFRPWHEHTGATMWWGQPYCTREEFIALWRETVTHLRDRRGVHQLLWAYSPNRRATPATYFERYPGDEWVDLLGFDFYSKGDLALAKPCLELAATEAAKRGKLAAFTETGPQGGLTKSGKPGYFTRELLATLADPSLRGLAYVLTWQNATVEQHWVPQVDGPLAEDFRAFYGDDFTLFERDLPKLYELPAAAPIPRS